MPSLPKPFRKPRSKSALAALVAAGVIAAGAPTAAVANHLITGRDIEDGTIRSADLAPGSVGAEKLKPGSVGWYNTFNAFTRAKIANLAGVDGLDGKNGVNGVNGKDGVDGKDGIDGAAGVDGKDGQDGATGPQGVAGAAGPQGETGPAGAAGPDGEAGADGATGPAGPKGDKGDTGAQGAKGDTGAQGPKGDTGAQGPKGDTGATGAQGPAGPAGAGGKVLKDGNNVTLGAVQSIWNSGVTILTSQGYLLDVRWDGSIYPAQAWYTGAGCTGTAYLNSGGPDDSWLYAKTLVYLASANTLAVPATIAASGAATNVTITAGGIDNPDCQSASTGYGWKLQATTATAVGLPSGVLNQFKTPLSLG